MVFSILSFVFGIVLVQQFTVLPELIWIIGLLLIACGSLYLKYWRLMFFVIGLLWAIVFASYRMANSLADGLEGQTIAVTGKVINLPRFDERRVRFDFLVIEPQDRLPEKIRLSWFFPQKKIKAGQIWRFTVKLKKPHGRVNPGGFDYEQWLFMQNVGATGYVKNKPSPQLVSQLSLWLSFDSIRQEIADRLNIILQQSNNLGVIKALTIGERSQINQQQWEVFKKTGTVHLLAISGLHIGLIAGMVYFISIKVCYRLTSISPQNFAALLTMLVALFYSALAGFSLPTQRSLIMLSITMMALTWQRNLSSVNTLALAIFGVLIFDPLAVLSAGFWLSFFAVSLIIYCLAGRLGPLPTWQSAIKVHCVTALGLAPLLLFYFQQVSVIAPIANFMAVPVISFLVVPLCLLAVLLMFFSLVLASQVFSVVDHILYWVGAVLQKLAGFSFAAVSITPPPFYTLPFAIIGVILLLAPRGVPARWLGLLMIMPLAFFESNKPKPGEVVMTVLDVGQGLSAVIETANHTLVFDSGAKYSEQFDMGSAVVIPFLKSKGISKVDVLLISHGDNDHIGGAESIIKQSQVDQVLTSAKRLLKVNRSKLCLEGQLWVWDQVVFEILSPPVGVLQTENNNSCVLQLRAKHGNILLTGDIEQSAENWLLENKRDKLKSEVLIAPHHGSNTSSTRPFLEQIKAEYILIPVGYKNRFSFPHKAVVRRYLKSNAMIMTTAQQGALIVELKNGRVAVRSERSIQGKYLNN